MEILILLIAVSLIVALVFLWLFVWSVKSGQYEDVDSPAIRILYDDKVVDKKDSSLNKK